MTIQMCYDKGLFDVYDDADEVSKGYHFFEVKERRRSMTVQTPFETFRLNE